MNKSLVFILINKSLAPLSLSLLLTLSFKLSFLPLFEFIFSLIGMNELIKVLLEQIISDIIIDNSENNFFWEYISGLKKYKKLHEFAILYKNKNFDFSESLINQLYLALEKYLKNVHPFLVNCIINNKIDGIIRDLKTTSSTILTYLSNYFLIQFNVHVVTTKKSNSFNIESGEKSRLSHKTIDLYLNIPQKKLIQSKPMNTTSNSKPISKRKQKETSFESRPCKKICNKPTSFKNSIINNVNEDKLTTGDSILVNEKELINTNIINDIQPTSSSQIAPQTEPFINVPAITSSSNHIETKQPINDFDMVDFLLNSLDNQISDDSPLDLTNIDFTDILNIDPPLTDPPLTDPPLTDSPLDLTNKTNTIQSYHNKDNSISPQSPQSLPQSATESPPQDIPLNSISVYDAFFANEKSLLVSNIYSINKSIDTLKIFLQKLEKNINNNKSNCAFCPIHCQDNIRGSLKARRGRPKGWKKNK